MLLNISSKYQSLLMPNAKIIDAMQKKFSKKIPVQLLLLSTSKITSWRAIVQKLVHITKNQNSTIFASFMFVYYYIQRR